MNNSAKEYPDNSKISVDAEVGLLTLDQVVDEIVKKSQSINQEILQLQEKAPLETVRIVNQIRTEIVIMSAILEATDVLTQKLHTLNIAEASSGYLNRLSLQLALHENITEFVVEHRTSNSPLMQKLLELLYMQQLTLSLHFTVEKAGGTSLQTLLDLIRQESDQADFAALFSKHITQVTSADASTNDFADAALKNGNVYSRTELNRFDAFFKDQAQDTAFGWKTIFSHTSQAEKKHLNSQLSHVCSAAKNRHSITNPNNAKHAKKFLARIQKKASQLNEQLQQFSQDYQAWFYRTLLNPSEKDFPVITEELIKILALEDYERFDKLKKIFYLYDFSQIQRLYRKINEQLKTNVRTELYSQLIEALEQIRYLRSAENLYFANSQECYEYFLTNEEFEQTDENQESTEQILLDISTLIGDIFKADSSTTSYTSVLSPNDLPNIQQDIEAVISFSNTTPKIFNLLLNFPAADQKLSIEMNINLRKNEVDWQLHEDPKDELLDDLYRECLNCCRFLLEQLLKTTNENTLSRMQAKLQNALAGTPVLPKQKGPRRSDVTHQLPAQEDRESESLTISKKNVPENISRIDLPNFELFSDMFSKWRIPQHLHRQIYNQLQKPSLEIRPISQVTHANEKLFRARAGDYRILLVAGDE